MQVLLRNNVPNLGRPGDIVTVKDGYARNYLLPKRLAVAVRASDLKAIEGERIRLQKIAEKERMETAAVAERLRDAEVTITAKANEEGHLFGSVGPDDVAAALTAKITPVDAVAVRMDEHIKDLGTHDVLVRLSQDFEVTVKVQVVGEEQAVQGEAAAQ